MSILIDSYDVWKAIAHNVYFHVIPYHECK